MFGTKAQGLQDQEIKRAFHQIERISAHVSVPVLSDEVGTDYDALESDVLKYGDSRGKVSG